MEKAIRQESIIDPYTIRQLREADAEDLRQIRLEALERHPVSFGTTVFEEAARPLNHYRDRLADPDIAIWAIYQGPLIIGMAGFSLHLGSKQSHRGFVHGVYLRQDARRKGLARRMLVAVISDALKKVEQVELDVLTRSTGARALYASLGFESIGVIPRARKVDGVVYDDEMMVLNPERWAALHGSLV